MNHGKPSEHQLATCVYAAKSDMQKADTLIRSYLPFIKKEASRFLGHFCSEQEDEYSISLMAFHEAILGYDKNKGAFLSYAGLTIRSRLMDYQRREARHSGTVSIHEKGGEDDKELLETIADPNDRYEETVGVEATRREIEELSAVMRSFDVSLTDVADNSPRQERTMEACRKIIRHAILHKELLEEMLRTKKLPITKLSAGTGVDKKTLERHRKYILAMLIIQTNGYEIIRGHLRHMLRPKGGVPA